MRKTNLVLLVIAVVITISSCKKDAIFTDSKSQNIKHQGRYATNVLESNRTLANAILAIEYQLNMDVADTNMLKGSEPYEAMSVDTFTFFDGGFDEETIVGDEQTRIYGELATLINDLVAEIYSNNPDAGVIAVDLEETTGETGTGVIVRIAHSIRTGNCDCYFTTVRPWSDLNIQSMNCVYFDDQANNYYANCIAVRENIGRYYDVKIENYPNSGDIYFPGSRISTETQTTVYLDADMSTSEQIVTRDYLYSHWENYAANHPDGSNDMLKLQIGGTVGFSNALYLHEIIRGRYSVGIPF